MWFASFKAIAHSPDAVHAELIRGLSTTNYHLRNLIYVNYTGRSHFFHAYFLTMMAPECTAHSLYAKLNNIALLSQVKCCGWDVQPRFFDMMNPPPARPVSAPERDISEPLAPRPGKERRITPADSVDLGQSSQAGSAAARQRERLHAPEGIAEDIGQLSKDEDDLHQPSQSTASGGAWQRQSRPRRDSQ